MAAYLRVTNFSKCFVVVLLFHNCLSSAIKKHDDLEPRSKIRGGIVGEDVKDRIRRAAVNDFNNNPQQQGQGPGGRAAGGFGGGAGDQPLKFIPRQPPAEGQGADPRFGALPPQQPLGPGAGNGAYRDGIRNMRNMGNPLGNGVGQGRAGELGGYRPNIGQRAGGIIDRQQGGQERVYQQIPQQNFQNLDRGGNPPPQPPKRTGPIRIASEPACANDVKRHCTKTGNNFAVLDCLQQAEADIASDCNHFLWTYKMNLTKDIRFDNAAGEVCREDLRKFQDCNGLAAGQGLILPCLLDHAENITVDQCKQYLNRMKEITFSDFRLIKGFYKDCQDDIERHSCGMVNENDQNAKSVPHNQGGTIHCLEKHIRDLQTTCRLQILRVAELSSNDYHEDRALYYACREDRENLCKKVVSGDGKVYKCLKEHKFDPEMSASCKEKLTVRQQVAAEDVRVNFRLYRRCKKEIQTAGCSVGQAKTKELKMANILLCLEQEEKNKHVQISGECRAELTDARKNIMSDYMINPELMKGCSAEIDGQCNGIKRQGKTIHCLMGLAKKNMLSEDCKEALSNLVEEVDAGSSYKLDKSLYNDCKDVKEKLCKEKTGADTLSCLMENIEAQDMNEDCAKKLLEIQYFISRNFRLDPLLYRNCETDAKDKCYYEFNSKDKVPTGLVFSCLHNHLHDTDYPLEPKCADQVHRVLRQRAVSVHLNPRIEENCRADLGRFCTDKTQRGEELQCLQDNIKELGTSCKRAVGNFTVEEAEDVRMNRKLIAACAPMLQKFCKDKLKAKKVDEGEALQCLIDHKNDDEMDEKCQASIEHFQLIQLKDFRFSFKFKESCRKNVLTLCKGARDKASIVTCLSEKLRNSIVTGQKPVLDPECRAQLKYELLQRDENIDLDPELNEACESEIKSFCKKISKGNARVLQCLRENQEDLGNSCHIKVFNREKEMASKPDIDYALMHACKKSIKAKCKDVEANKLVDCLKDHKDDPDTEPRCKTVLTNRQIERNSNIELNPLLQKACKLDIPKFCSQVKSEGSDKDVPNMEGNVIQCLREEFSKKDSRLSPTCSKHIRGVIKEGAEDFRLDRTLVKHCMRVINDLCSEEMEEPGSGRVEECLKKKLAQIKDQSCQQQVINLFREGLADVHVDPLLYKACALDIKHYCVGIPQGQGQQMSCLLEALDQKTVRLQQDCYRMLSERKEMWEYAAKVAPVEGMFDLYVQLQSSPSRNYFLLVFMSFIGTLFMCGMCCGRASKRVRHDVKNR